MILPDVRTLTNEQRHIQNENDRTPFRGKDFSEFRQAHDVSIRSPSSTRIECRFSFLHRYITHISGPANARLSIVQTEAIRTRSTYEKSFI